VVGGDVSVSVDRSTINSRCPVGGVALLVSILDRYAPTHQAVPFTPRYTSAFLSYSQLWGRRLPAYRRTWSLIDRRVTRLETRCRPPGSRLCGKRTGSGGGQVAVTWAENGMRRLRRQRDRLLVPVASTGKDQPDPRVAP
jgi:hypothetical protein